MRTLVVMTILATTLTGCVMGPRNGDTVEGSPKGKSLKFEGYFNKPGIPVEIQVLKTPGHDPAQSTSWDWLTTTSTGSQPIYWNSTDPLYLFSATVTPVPFIPTRDQAARWPTGKLVRLRAVAKDPGGDRVLTIFDSTTFDRCFQEHSSENWTDIGTKCASPFSPLAVVSTAYNPADLYKGVNTFDYLGRKGDPTEDETAIYYAFTGAPPTLGDFKTKYGFPAGEVVATYYNEADLGFGREMHCKSFGPENAKGVACYVKNYGTVSQQEAFPADPASALNLAISKQGHFATVAMVYTPPNGPDAIKFIVYGKDDKLAYRAPLDSTGAHASIPNNCLSCHGINTVVSTTQTLPPRLTVSGNARFLPFDVFSFKYSEQAGYTEAAQHEAFRKLNALVALTPMTPATSQFLTGLYGGKPASDPTALATDHFIPPAWGTNKQDQLIYQGVVKPFCRGCHMSAVVPSLDFDSPAEFSAGAPCDPSHPMPHAEHTLRRFWNSGARAYLTQAYGVANDCSQ